MLLVIFSSILSFVGTNIDDLFLILVLLSQTKTKIEKTEVIIGQTIGIFLLIITSILAACGFHFFSNDYAHYLGILPIIIGIKEGMKNYLSDSRIKNKINIDNEKQIQSVFSYSKILKVLLLSLANGIDNITVYIPLFANFTVEQILISSLSIMLMAVLWCFFAEKLLSFSFIKNKIECYQTFLVPAIYILIGIMILFE